jgi:hypothetical protein
MMQHRAVRGCWLTSGIKFLRTHYPPETNERLLGALPKALRTAFLELQPVSWYPRSHHIDLMSSIVSAHRDEASAYQSLTGYGQLVATDACNGPLRPLLPILTPKLLARKLPKLWANDHQEDGALDVDISHVEDGRLSIRMAGLDDYAHVGVATLGWIKGFLAALGARDVVLNQTGWSLGHAAPNELTGEVRWS